MSIRNRVLPGSAVIAPLSIVLLPLALIGADSISAGGTPPAGFVEVNADRVPWQPRPSMPGTEIAILLGEPREPGPLVVRVRLPANQRVPPHTHPDARTYTVLAGDWKLGFGDKFHPDEAAQLPDRKPVPLARAGSAFPGDWI